MADLKNAVENVLDRIRGKRPASEPAPSVTAEPAVPPEKVPSATDATTPLDKKSEDTGETKTPPAAGAN